MSDDRPVALSKWQRDMLDAMPPEARHEWSDRWHRERHLLLAQADAMDMTADLVSRAGPMGKLTNGYMVAAALQAEAFRALARNDVGRARELIESSAEHHPELGAHGQFVLKHLSDAEEGQPPTAAS